MEAKETLQSQPNETTLLADFCIANSLMFRYAIDGVQVGRFSSSEKNEIIYKTFRDIDALVLWM